jgi:hypothetical protein
MSKDADCRVHYRTATVVSFHNEIRLPLLTVTVILCCTPKFCQGQLLYELDVRTGGKKLDDKIVANLSISNQDQ